jgi:uncharacterized protein (TIGR02996 family)
VSDEDALLAAICADPADDTVRLAFADFLQERGGAVEGAWAMFIRAHLRLSTGVEAAGDGAIVQRLSKDYWLKQFAKRLGFPTESGVLLEEWERGFPNKLDADYPVAKERWALLVERVPFRQLRLGGMEDEAVEDLVTWPRLERLTALDLNTWDGTLVTRTLSQRGVAALTKCSTLRDLESLEVRFLDVTERVANLFLKSRCLSGLQNLALHTHEEPDERAAARLTGRWPNSVQ